MHPRTDRRLSQGQFFPIFILTVTSLVTLPLTYTLIRPASASEKPGPRIKTDYKAKDAAVVEDLRKAEKKQHRRVTRALVVLAGWTILGAMAYLIVVTQRITPKLWNPYDILGISDVRGRLSQWLFRDGILTPVCSSF